MNDLQAVRVLNDPEWQEFSFSLDFVNLGLLVPDAGNALVLF